MTAIEIDVTEKLARGKIEVGLITDIKNWAKAKYASRFASLSTNDIALLAGASPKLENALDQYKDFLKAVGAAEILEFMAPLCGDGQGGWCTTLFADAQGYGWCQVHSLRRKVGLDIARATVKIIETP